MELKEGGCPWKEHLFDLETELSIQPSIKFVIYTDQNGKYRVQVKIVINNNNCNNIK